MDVREKLVKLIIDAKRTDPEEGSFTEYLADHLITNGVTVQVCKLGAKKTNADRIRAMNDEELAMCLYEIGYDRGWNALEGTLDWLQQPAEEADNETVGERKDGDGNG